MGGGFFRGWVRLIAVYVACASLSAQSGRWEQLIADGRRALDARDFETAETRFEAALDESAGFAPNDPRKAQALVQMARFHRAQGDFAKPEALYRQALTAAERALGPKTAACAAYKHETAGYYHARRKYDVAEDLYKEAFGQRVRELGREHIDVAQSINDLGVLYENKAAFEKARVYYEHALAIREKLLGPDHLDTVTTVEHLARLFNKTRQGAKARELAERAGAVREGRVERYNAGGAQPTEIFSLREVRREPRVDGRVEPEYTDAARIARHEGAVVLQVTIDREGRAGRFRLLRSLGLGLDEKAVEAVRQWKFRPARKDGKRVAVLANLEILFRLM